MNESIPTTYVAMENYIKAGIALDIVIITVCTAEFVLLAKKSCRSKLDPIEILLVSLCISDFSCGFASLVIDSLYLNNANNQIKHAIEFFFTFFLLSSNFHVLSMAAGRFIAVLFPKKYLKCDVLRRNKFIVAVLWMTSVVAAPLLHFMSPQFLHGAILSAICSLTLLTYLTLFVLLKSREQRIRNILPQQIQERIHWESKVCLLVGILFFICIFPFSLGSMSSRLYHPIGSLLVTLNHLLNPLVYFFKYHIDGKKMRNHNTADNNEVTEGMQLTVI